MFDCGVAPLVEMERKKISCQNVPAKITGGQNKLLQSKQELINLQLEIRLATQDYADKIAKVENKIRSYRNQYEQLQKQVWVMENNYNNYTLLLKQEELRFRNGESSLFILNSRESKLVEAAQKLIELEIKYRKAYYAVLWSAGLLVANE